MSCTRRLIYIYDYKRFLRSFGNRKGEILFGLCTFVTFDKVRNIFDIRTGFADRCETFRTRPQSFRFTGRFDYRPYCTSVILQYYSPGSIVKWTNEHEVDLSPIYRMKPLTCTLNNASALSSRGNNRSFAQCLQVLLLIGADWIKYLWGSKPLDVWADKGCATLSIRERERALWIFLRRIQITKKYKHDKLI